MEVVNRDPSQNNLLLSNEFMMKKKFVLIFLIFFSHISFSESSIKILCFGDLTLKYQKQFTGQSRCIKSGSFSNYKDGVLHGESFHIESNGALIYKTNHKNGVQQNIINYYKDDQVKFYENFNIEDISLSNNLLSFFELNSKKKEERSYKDGELRGAYLIYSKNGKVIESYNYLNNQLLGDFSTFYPSGQIKTKGFYLSNKNKNGIFTWWYESGQKWVEVNYENNMIINRVEWDKNGDKKWNCFGLC